MVQRALLLVGAIKFVLFSLLLLFKNLNSCLNVPYYYVWSIVITLLHVKSHCQHCGSALRFESFLLPLSV
jgi:hypothetical protein